MLVSIVIYTNLVAHLKGYFDVTTKQATEIEYLNICIVQTQHSISFSQTDHIKETIFDKFFPPSTTERLKTVHMYFHTDSQTEIDLSEELPIAEKQLVLPQKRYYGTYAEIIGQLMHIFVWT